MKRLLSLSLFLMTAMLSFAYDFESGGIYYKITSSSAPYTVAVTYKETSSSQYSNEYTGDVTIPATVIYSGKTYSVTSIGDDAFSGCSGLTYVNIPNSVTTIRDGAFSGCSSLTSVNIPNSVTKIGRFAFRECSSLTSITIPNSVTSIGSHAFSGCSGLTSVSIPNKVTSIYNYTFRNCSSLTSINIPNSVTSIGEEAFSGCSSLTSVNIPNSVTAIGDGAFSGCSGLTSVDIPNSVTNIGSSAFLNCSGLTSVTFPNSVKSIDFGTFYGCSSLTTVSINSNDILATDYSQESYDSSLKNIFGTQVQNYIIGNDVTSIGKKAFSRCTGLTSITIPSSVTAIGNDAFYGCSNLTSVTINGDSILSKNYTSNFSFKHIFGTQVQKYVIGNDVTRIGDYAFSGCRDLVSVNIPISVTTIGYDAFELCGDLKKVIVPDIAAWCKIQFNSISSNPLSCAGHIYSDENKEIKDLVIPNGVRSIGDNTFYGCNSLSSVTIPNSVTSLGDYAFYGCTGLTSVTIGNSVTTIGGSAFEGCSSLTSITIPNSVTSIERCAFYGCSGLTYVKIPNSITSIEGGVFSYCNGLTSVDIPNSVTSIGGNAFSYCGGLTSVDIPNSVTTIGDYAFYQCNGLISITIGNGVTGMIGPATFYGCRSLQKVIVKDIAAWCNISFESNPLSYAHHLYSDEDTEITKLVIPNSVTSIGRAAFPGCISLTSVTIPNSVTSIGKYAFDGCSGLTSVTIPNSVTSIGDYAFFGCIGLTSVTIPSSVTSIGDVAFAGCTGLKEITSYIQEPFAINYGCWYDVNKSIPLYVPAGTKEKYQSTNYWKDFTNIIEFGGERIEPATGPQEVDMAAVPDQMDLNGMVVGDTYYVLDADNGDGADSENGCVVIITTTNDEAVNGIAGKDISDASVKAVFKGIIFIVPAGTGTISINAETLGTSSLKVKIGSQPAQAFQLAERETVEIPYNVSEPTYVYIYAGTGIQAARSVGAARAVTAENSVKVYSYKWEPTDPTGISSVDNSQSATGNEAGDWYTIDGRKLSGKAAQKGIYIVNGRKVAVK